MADRVPLSEILPTETPPTCGRIVLVKFLNHSTGDVCELPGLVIRRGPPRAALESLHETVTVATFCDAFPFAGQTVLTNLVLLDPLGGKVPAVDMQVYGPMPGYTVWAEWMPFQAKRHAEIRSAAEIPTATPVA